MRYSRGRVRVLELHFAVREDDDDQETSAKGEPLRRGKSKLIPGVFRRANKP